MTVHADPEQLELLAGSFSEFASSAGDQLHSVGSHLAGAIDTLETRRRRWAGKTSRLQHALDEARDPEARQVLRRRLRESEEMLAEINRLVRKCHTLHEAHQESSRRLCGRLDNEVRKGIATLRKLALSLTEYTQMTLPE